MPKDKTHKSPPLLPLPETTQNPLPANIPPIEAPPAGQGESPHDFIRRRMYEVEQEKRKEKKAESDG